MEFVLPSWVFFENRRHAKQEVISNADAKEERKKFRALFCVYCDHAITANDQSVSMNGGHIHEFPNPHGIVFRIGCFETADGCIRVGHSTDEWTWFKGYSWCIANCANCHSHMGWHFADNVDHDFFGLILCNLVENA